MERPESVRRGTEVSTGCVGSFLRSTLVIWPFIITFTWDEGYGLVSKGILIKSKM